jgi:formylglycine-generating enzyme required for sulfatase activity
MSGAMRGVRVLEDPVLARRADPDLLSLALMDARNRTLRWLSVFEAGGAWAANPDAAHPVAPWRCIGRAGWFQEQWIARHVQRRRGEAADPDAPRLPSIDPMADRWFGPVEGAAPGSAATRRTWRAWSTRDDAPPDPVEVRRYLADTLETTLDLLASSALDDLSLHGFRLALMHEDRLSEGLAQAAQWLAVPPIDQDPGVAGPPARAQREPLQVGAGPVSLGASADEGLVPPNERWAHSVEVAAFEIDAQPVCWARFSEFVEDGGYDEPRWWTESGWAWVQAQGRRAPRGVEQMRGAAMAQRRGQIRRLPATQAATHLTLHEAEAWCRWVGRRLPTEAEWVRARAAAAHRGWVWGDVWEWMLDGPRPYPGGQGARVAGFSTVPTPRGWGLLRGASAWTLPRAAHPGVRRAAEPERDDLFCGFRSCAL